MISQKVRRLFKNRIHDKSEKKEPKVHPYLARRQEQIESQKQVHSTKNTQISNRGIDNKRRVQSNVQELLRQALKEKSQSSRKLTPIPRESPVASLTPITPIRPNGTVRLPEKRQHEAPTTIDTADTPMMNTDQLAMRMNSIPLRLKMEHDVYYNEYDNRKTRVVYGIHDCIYKSIIRVMMWYRGKENTSEPIQTPNMRKYIDMVNERVPWKEWIHIQQELIQKDKVPYKEREFTRCSFPSWNKWHHCVVRIDKNRQETKDMIELTTKETPTIQTMCQWLFDEYYMGCIVIPKMHIFTCLLIDSTCLLEWPFLFGVKNNHVYPIMNNSCCNDWLDTPSVLESHYRVPNNKKKSFPTLEKNKTIKQKVLGMAKRKYDFLIDKDTRRQYTLLTIQNELNNQDFILVPFWSLSMMNTLRRAIYQMMRNPYAKKSSVFSKAWASHLESIFSFYEKEYTFMDI